MGFHRIDEVPDVRLAHLVDRYSYFNGRGTTTATRYQLHPVGIRRPAEGRTTRAVRCGTCNKDVQVAVPSAALALRTQRLWLVPTVLWGAVIVFCLGWMLSRGRVGIGLVLIAVVFLILTLGGFFGLLGRARTAHGVSVPPRQPGRASIAHSIRVPPARAEGAKVRHMRAKAERERRRLSKRG